eukprot:TRINITY_DN93386_c0_g1_i1.p1 TRINITY_DN93386_c0_g1~~TRINITY_DN93386_c0_g1_i1.p1  ORF type:complete len:302 (-),score=37.97 TRINITY_DN93386_c0_g1_i1:476-1381(-)
MALSSAQEQQQPECVLLGVFGLLVQSCLALCITAFVLLKWNFEAAWYGKRRRFRVFLLDVSKQIVGATFVHCLNIGQALLLQRVLNREGQNGGADENNQCVWYLIGLVCDCVFSTIFCAMLMDMLRPFLLRRFGMDVGNYTAFEMDEGAARRRIGSNTSPCSSHQVEGAATALVHFVSPTKAPPRMRASLGEQSMDQLYYKQLGTAAEDPPRPPSEVVDARPGVDGKKWALQTLVWCLVVFCVRLGLLVPVLVFHEGIYTALQRAVFSGLDAEDQMIMALVVAPLLGNMFQFAVVDHFLKK